MLFLCVFSPRSLSWAGPLSPSEDIPRAGLRKTAGFGQETSQAQSAQYFSYLQRHSSPSSFKFCQKNKEKKNKKTPSKTRKKNHPTQTDKLKRQQRSYRDGKKKNKKGKKEGKKRKLRHSCIAPKTTGNSPQVGQVWQVGYVHVQGRERLRCCHQSASSSM